MSSSAPNDPLRNPLPQWQLWPRRSSQFRSSVWARIEAASQPSTWARFARSHPAAVTATLALAVALGAWSGRAEARERTEADRASIASNYVHALDARWMRQR